MNILFVTQYFPPESGAAQSRLWDFAKRMVQFGHRVTVITAFPNWPSGKKSKEYRRKFLRISREHGITVVRTYVLATGGMDYFRAMLLSLSFMCSSIAASLLIRKCDLVFATSPPLFCGIAGLIISKMKRVPFVFDVRDIWPGPLFEIAGIQNNMILKSAEQLEMLLYTSAQKVVVVTEGYKRELTQRGVPKNKIKVVTNGTDIHLFKPIHFENSEAKWNSNDKFVVLYAGNHGVAQGLCTILEAAEKLRDKNIFFKFVGDGAEKSKLVALKERLDLKNVLFFPQQPRNAMPQLFAKAHVGIVHLRRIAAHTTTIPSKVYDYMACGLPIIMGVEGDSQQLLHRARAGICVSPEDPQQLANAILKLYHQKELLEFFGKNGREFVVRNYAKEHLAKQLELVFRSIA